MSCGDDPDVDLNRFSPTHPLQLASLQHSQQLYLCLWRKLPYLVQKECPTVGTFKTASFFRHCPGEGALFVPEKFAVDERICYGSAIDLNKGPLERVDP